MVAPIAEVVGEGVVGESGGLHVGITADALYEHLLVEEVVLVSGLAHVDIFRTFGRYIVDVECVDIGLVEALGLVDPDDVYHVGEHREPNHRKHDEQLDDYPYVGFPFMAHLCRQTSFHNLWI